MTKTYYSLNHRKPWLTIISSAVKNLRLPDDQHLTKIQIKFSISEIDTSTRSVGDDYNLRNLEFELFWLLWPPLIPLICNKATNDILMKFHVMVTWLSLVIITTTITWGHARPLGHMTHLMICRNAFSDQRRCHWSEKQGHHCPLDHSKFSNFLRFLEDYVFHHLNNVNPVRQNWPFMTFNNRSQFHPDSDVSSQGLTDRLGKTHVPRSVPRKCSFQRRFFLIKSSFLSEFWKNQHFWLW